MSGKRQKDEQKKMISTEEIRK